MFFIVLWILLLADFDGDGCVAEKVPQRTVSRSLSHDQVLQTTPLTVTRAGFGVPTISTLQVRSATASG